jgi:hypothetical protein
MHGPRAHLTYANVMATIAVFIALGGAAYAANTVGSDDVIDDSLQSVDLKNNDVGSADLKNNAAVQGQDVRNGTLEDEDVGEGTFVHFNADVGTVLADDCKRLAITGINAEGDHLLLTPSGEDSNNIQLTYGVQYNETDENATLQVCNDHGFPIDDASTHFNLLVFDAN